MSEQRPATVVVLAAGQGTRMRSTSPKVLHAVAGRTLVGHVLAAVAGLRPEHLLVVVGHGREAVAGLLADIAPEARAVVQAEQRGTGHAVRTALDTLPDLEGTVVVLPGDSPLITSETLRYLVEVHQGAAAATTLLTASMPDPTGYGRVIRDTGGAVRAVVEQRDADADQLAVREVATSMYAFEAAALREALGRLGTANAQGEEYLTDVIAIQVEAGLPVGAVTTGDWRETGGVNDRAQLAAAGATLREKLLHAAMLSGVTVVDPTTTWVDADVVLEPDCTIEPFTTLHGRTRVEAGAVVGPSTRLVDTVVMAGATVLASTCLGAEIGPGATVGPYSYLRPGTRLGRRAKAGAFVEMKGAVVGDDSKVPHLSYVGDAVIGTGSNIGAATIFVNYDGQAKHRTTVGDEVRIGSDTMLVAPVSIGHGAYTAAGSVITEDVPAGAMAVARGRQRTIEGWVQRKRAGSSSARAAAQASPSAETDGPTGATPAEFNQGATQ